MDAATMDSGSSRGDSSSSSSSSSVDWTAETSRVNNNNEEKEYVFPPLDVGPMATTGEKSSKKRKEVISSGSKADSKRSNATVYERKRREKINQRLNTLGGLVPTCRKSDDKVSLLDKAIEHMKHLQENTRTFKNIRETTPYDNVAIPMAKVNSGQRQSVTIPIDQNQAFHSLQLPVVYQYLPFVPFQHGGATPFSWKIQPPYLDLTSMNGGTMMNNNTSNIYKQSHKVNSSSTATTTTIASEPSL